MELIEGTRRYYLVMNDHYQHLGKYLTFLVKKSKLDSIRYYPGISRLVIYSDIVIMCDDDCTEPVYAKNCFENATAKIDPDDFAWIKLSSTEIDTTHI